MTSTIPTYDEILQIAIKTFQNTFNNEPTIGSCAPGRVNLIGEHIDYNDGYVLPIALPMVTIIVGRINDSKDNRNVDIVACSDDCDSPKRLQFNLNDDLKPGNPKWGNYIKGVIHCYGNTDIPGFNAVVITNVPVGGGLSSSAALEVSTLIFLEAIAGKSTLKLTEKSLICQKAEHQFAGMPCGIMDQLVSVMAQEKHALLIDCQLLETFQIPFKTNNSVICLICNSNVRHELSNSEYPTRRKQCNKALELMGLKSYKDATIKDLQVLKNLSEDILIKRARHVITEIQRTYEAAEALKKCDFIKMGKLMTESHLSLRDDFEVSCKELDILVDTAINCSGVLGSRMTGGGFGGCTITLLYKENVDSVIKDMKIVYEGTFSSAAALSSSNEQHNKKEQQRRHASFYICEPSKGARLINLG